MEEPIEVLQNRLSSLQATQASLQADAQRAKERPSSSRIKKAAKRGRTQVSSTLQELSRKVADVEEKCILYRTAGWTVFEMDLDIGKRQRIARRQMKTSTSLIEGKSALALGIRLETFYEGRFYEPYYLIFARTAQLVKNQAEAIAPLLDDTLHTTTTNSTHQRSIRLMRHTIPHFIPLSDILHSYLRADNADNEDSDGEKSGGLQLLDRLMKREGLYLFLSHLHANLQSFVSRRQQAIALAQLPIPGLAQSSLRAFGNDSFGQLNIRWNLPSPTSKDLHFHQQEGDILYTNGKVQEGMEIAASHKSQGAVNTSLEISIVYHNLSSDRVGRPAKEMSARQQLIQASTNDELIGLKCTYATVLVETIRSRVPAPRRGGHSDKMEKLQVQRTRKIDWEVLFTQPHDSVPDLHKTLGAILQLAWKEEMQRVSPL